MKKKIIFILISIIVSNWHCFSQTDNYYFYKDKKIAIDINEKMYYILISDTTDLTNYFANSNFQITEKKHGAYFDKSNNKIKKYWKLIEITSENVNQKEEITTWLSKNSSLEQICPVVGEKYPIAVSEYFYIKLKTKDDFGLLDSIANKMSCNLIGEVANMPLWYTLKSERNSNALNLANYFYSTNYFQEADPGFIFNFKTTCIDDEEFDEQWGLENSTGVDIDACNAWEITKGNSCIVVGVVDKGIDSTHNEFSSNLFTLSYDCENNTFPAQLEGEHGTHVSGIVGANQNGSQVSGVAPMTSLMSVSHSLLVSSTMSQELASGISWAWHNGADIINCSWGDQGGAYFNELHSTLLESAIDSALLHGRNGLGSVVLFASGNHASSIDYPAYYTSDIICIGSINTSGTRASTSAYGTNLDVVAPGVNILSTVPSNETDEMSGTSMATPHVAGVAALVLSVNPDLTQDEARDFIESTCTKVGSYSYSTTSGRDNGTWDDEVGYGCVNAYAALTKVLDQMNLSISGPSTVCSTGASFTVSNLPSGDTVFWSKSNNLTRVSAQGANPGIFAASSSGDGWIQATINSSCGSITLPKKEVWVGRPRFTIVGTDELYPKAPGFAALCEYGTTDPIMVGGENDPGITDVQWSYSGPLDYITGETGINYRAKYAAGLTSGQGLIYADATNACGYVENNMYYTVEGWLRLFFNPAEGTL